MLIEVCAHYKQRPGTYILGVGNKPSFRSYVTYQANYQIGYGEITHSFLLSIYEDGDTTNYGFYYVTALDGVIRNENLHYLAGTLNAITVKTHQHTALEIFGGIDSNKTYKIGSIRIA